MNNFLLPLSSQTPGSSLPPSPTLPPAHKGHPLAAETDSQKKGPGTRPGPGALHALWMVHHIHAATFRAQSLSSEEISVLEQYGCSLVYSRVSGVFVLYELLLRWPVHSQGRDKNLVFAQRGGADPQAQCPHKGHVQAEDSRQPCPAPPASRLLDWFIMCLSEFAESQ